MLSNRADDLFCWGVMIVDEDGSHVEQFLNRGMAPNESLAGIMLCEEMTSNLERVVSDHSRRRRERCSTN